MDSANANRPTPVGIVGGTGYTGGELLRLFAGHPAVRVAAVTSRAEAGRSVAAVYPHLAGRYDLDFSEPSPDAFGDCEVVFFATPHAAAMHLVPVLLDAGKRVVDLSADFRLTDSDLWAQWYGEAHACPQLLDEAVYGLPELNRDRLADARLVACPGCYPTAVILALLPLLEAGVIARDDLIADAKTGVSGAGRTLKTPFLFGEMGESFKAYGVSGHRHLPEIRQVLGEVAGADVGVSFVPHLVPMIRGIFATNYARLTDAGADLQGLFEARYRNEPFVEVLAAGGVPETREVRGANTCRIAVHPPLSDGRIIVLSAIDNLVKGAAGQAVQCFNLMQGLPEAAGLDTPALSP